MKKKTIMVDMDDVITENRFQDYLESFLGKEIDMTKEDVIYRQDLIRGREKEFQKQYQYHNLYEDAPLIEGCYEVLKRLHEKYEIYVVTSYIWRDDVISASDNLKNKFEYLKEMLPFLNPKNFIFTENKSLLAFDIRIDDRVSGLKNGSLKLLFPSWSNQKIEEEVLKKEGIIRVKDWYDVEKKIEKMEKELVSFQSLVPELSVRDWKRSKAFYQELGFHVLYERKEDRFCYLELEKNQIMIEEVNDHWTVGKLEYPYGNGVNFSMELEMFDFYYEKWKKQEIVFFRDLMVNTYRNGDHVYQDREVLIQDPDGYLLRFHD